MTKFDKPNIYIYIHFPNISNIYQSIFQCSNKQSKLHVFISPDKYFCPSPQPPPSLWNAAMASALAVLGLSYFPS